MNVCIDTLRLTLKHIDPNRLHGFDASINSEAELKQLHKVVKMNETEDCMYNGTIGMRYNHTHGYLNINISSLPKLIHGTSYSSVTAKDILSLPELLSKYVGEHIDYDISELLNDASITRLDNSIILETEYPIYQYIEYVNSITRNKEYNSIKKYYQGQTVQFNNNSMSVGLYDKYDKNKINELETENYAGEVSVNSLRYEIQNKKSSIIRRETGIYKISDLQDVDRLKAMHHQRKKQFDRYVKNITPKKYDMKQNNEMLDELNYDELLMATALQTGAITIQDIEILMKHRGESRQLISKKLKKYKALVLCQPEAQKLYNELRTKIYQAA